MANGTALRRRREHFEPAVARPQGHKNKRDRMFGRPYESAAPVPFSPPQFPEAQLRLLQPSHLPPGPHFFVRSHNGAVAGPVRSAMGMLRASRVGGCSGAIASACARVVKQQVAVYMLRVYHHITIDHVPSHVLSCAGAGARVPVPA